MDVVEIFLEDGIRVVEALSALRRLGVLEHLKDTVDGADDVVSRRRLLAVVLRRQKSGWRVNRVICKSHFSDVTVTL